MFVSLADQSLTFDSPFGSLATTIIFVLAIAAVGWMILRERRVLGTFWQGTFFLTRVVAILAIFWMLLQPARINTMSNQSPLSVAILVDRSPSMDVSDSLSTVEMLSWKSLVDESLISEHLASIDQSLLHTGHLSRLCKSYRDHLLHHSSLDTKKSLADQLTNEVTRTGELLATLSKLNETPATSDITHEILSDYRGQIEGYVRQKLSSSDDSESNPDIATAVAEFDAFSSSLSQIHDQLKRLQRSYIQSQLDQSSDSLGTDRTRRELIATLMDGLESSSLSQLPDHVRVSRISFDEAPEHLVEPVDWTQTLLNRSSNEVPGIFRTISLIHQDVNESDTVQTDLTAALESLQREMLTRKFRFALLITEGRHNPDTTIPPAELAKQLDGLPIYTVPIGNSATRRDAILHRVSAPTTVVQGDQAVIRAIVSAYDCIGETVTVNLIKLGQVVQSQTIDVQSAEMDHRISFQVPTEILGRSEYEVSIEEVSDEVTTKNNSAAVSVEVVRDKLRILLADNFPRWEYRYLQQLFRRDSHVEHDEALFQPQLHLTGDLTLSGGLPRTLENWATYDVVILGDLTLEQLDSEQQEQLATYVSERGGKVVLISGSEQMPHQFADLPLGRLLPVVRGRSMLRPTSSYAVELTTEGDTHPAMLIADSLSQSRQLWHQIYTKIPMTSLSAFHELKPSARSLADVKLLPTGQASADVSQLPDMPTIGSFVSWQRVGKGHVVFLASPSSYNLRFRQGDKYHHRFWGQLLRWLTAADLSTGTELVRIQTDKTRYSRGEDVTATVRLTDASGQPIRTASVHVQAKSNDDIVASIPLQEDEKVPGLYRAVFEKLRAGVYKIEPEGDIVKSLMSQQKETEHQVSTLVAIEELLNTEMINTELNLPLLEQISASTGGQVISPLAIPALFRMTNFDPEVTTRTETTPLWNRWPLLWLIAGCLSFEWFVRKQKGLL